MLVYVLNTPLRSKLRDRLSHDNTETSSKNVQKIRKRLYQSFEKDKKQISHIPKKIA